MLATIPRGTKDILPNEIYKWTYLEEKMREAAALYGFSEIRTPMFEYTELFLRGIGDTTDVVEKEMYTFTDRGNRSITLRPENTASAVRAYLQNKLYANTNLVKLFYIGSMFRYDKPQAGRYREFHQFGVESIGTADPYSDAEIIAFANDFLCKILGLKDIVLKLNSVGCPKCRAAYKKALQDFFKPHYDELCSDCQGRFDRNPLRILDCKNETCKALGENAPQIVDYLCPDCAAHFTAVQKYLQAAEVPYVLDPTLVRGLDYYTRTAFEFKFLPLGAQSTVLGGGRYDGLIEECGGKHTPAIGFASGLERLLLALEMQELLPPAPQGCDVFLITLGEQAKMVGLKLLREMRAAKLSALTAYDSAGMKSQMKQANRAAARYAVIIGDDELARNVAVLRNMQDSEQKEIPLSAVIKNLIFEVKK